MAVHHNKQRRFFVSIDANIVRGNALSLPALGLLTVLLDRPAWWEVYAVEIARTLGVELLTLQPLFAELEQKGFVRMRRGERGPCYDVYENPMPPSQTAPPPERPSVDRDSQPVNFALVIYRLYSARLSAS